MQELNHYRVFEMKDPDDATALQRFIEKVRVYDFLAGLNSKFDQVRVQILGKDKVPSLEETISMIQDEESRRGVMLEAQNLEGSAMVVAKPELSHPIQENVKEVQFPKTFGRDNKKNLWCTYCKKTDTQRKLVGNFMANHVKETNVEDNSHSSRETMDRPTSASVSKVKNQI